MQDFLARAFAALALCLLSASYSFGAEPSAASSAPRGLAPPVVQEPLPPSEDMPPDVMPGAPQTSAPVLAEEAVPDQPGQPRGPKVMVSALEDIDPSGAGLIDEPTYIYKRLGKRHQHPRKFVAITTTRNQ